MPLPPLKVLTPPMLLCIHNERALPPATVLF